MTLRSAVLVLGLAVLMAQPALAAPPAGIAITKAWTRPVAAGQTDAGYMTVTNTGKSPDRLVSASSAQAAAVSIHRSEMSGDMAKMADMPVGVDLAPGQTVRFEPGAYHLMFQGLKTPQKIGAVLPATLTFLHAGKVKVSFAVGTGPG